MFQAIVHFRVTGTNAVQEWDTWEQAAESLVGLLRVSGYDHPNDDIKAELKRGGIEYGTRRYYVEERP